MFGACNGVRLMYFHTRGTTHEFKSCIPKRGVARAGGERVWWWYMSRKTRCTHLLKSCLFVRRAAVGVSDCVPYLVGFAYVHTGVRGHYALRL